MESATDRIFVQFSVNKLKQLAGRVQDCLGRLSADQVWSRGSENENAIGNIVLHLCGNLRQWIGTGVGGKPDIRVRDREFAARGDIEPADLAERLRTGVDDATAIISAVTSERLSQKMTPVQNYDVTVLEAIYHVVEHFAQHTGQIIYATKQLRGEDLGYYKHLTKAAHQEKTP
jgi:uncharacterized damage-inducible protein DinB